MSYCANCGRDLQGGVYVDRDGPERFCSKLCSDTARPQFVCAWCGVATTRPIEALDQRVGGTFCSRRCADAATDAANCTVPDCAVCSGAMRSRAGKGDRS